MHTRRFEITAISIIGLALLCLTVIVSTAVAESAMPDIGGAVKQAAPPAAESPAKKEAKESPVIVQEAEKPFTMSEGEKIFIQDFKLEGIDSEDEAKLEDLLSPYRSRELTMAEITQAANKVTLFYRDKGYLVAKAYVPKQDASNGILTILMVPGNYGKFVVKNISPIRDSFLQGVFDNTKKTSPIVTRDGLERSMLLVAEMPGSKMPMVTIAPGEVSGTSDFVVSVDESQRFNGYIMGDNQGSSYTGKKRLYGGVDVNSPFGFADKLSINGMTTNKGDLESIRGAYAFPLAHNGLRAELGVSRTKYELGGIYSALDATGSADVVEGTISYPIRRSRREKVDLFLNAAYKGLRDDLSAVDSENPRGALVTRLSLQRMAYSTLGGHNLFTSITGSVNLGTLDIRDDTQKALNEAGADTDGTYSKFNFSFIGDLSLTEAISFKASVKLQKVIINRNLDSTEQMFISGIGGVRAYTESVSFDNGYVASMEVRYNLPPVMGVKHALGVFVDNGWVYAQNGDYTTDDDIRLTDYGAGYYASFKKFFGNIQWADPNGSSCIEDPGTRVLAQVGMVF